jgi:hypothetical protein
MSLRVEDTVEIIVEIAVRETGIATTSYVSSIIAVFPLFL